MSACQLINHNFRYRPPAYLITCRRHEKLIWSGLIYACHLSLEKLIPRSWNGTWRVYKPRYLPSVTASSSQLNTVACRKVRNLTLHNPAVYHGTPRFCDIQLSNPCCNGLDAGTASFAWRSKGLCVVSAPPIFMPLIRL